MTDTKLDQILNQIETSMTVAYLGYQSEASKSEASKPKADRWPHFAWRVTVIRNGESYSTDYKTGIGHAKPMPRGFPGTKEQWLSDKRAPIVPSVASVVYGLISDGQCGSETFEDFCGNLGYDTDSRKALDTYLACQGAHKACLRLFGEHYQAVCEAAQDY